MKKQTLRSVLREFSSFLLFFLIVGFVVTCCMMLFLNTMADSIGLTFTSDNIASAAKITFINVQGSDGEHHLQFSPGLAIDTNRNYSKSVEAIFYLYADEKNIDLSDPEITLSALSISSGETKYRMEVTDNMCIRSFDLDEKDITTIGFSADIRIEYVTTFSDQHVIRIIHFKNIKNTSDSEEKFFIINSGIATDAFSNQSSAIISPSFVLSE